MTIDKETVSCLAYKSETKLRGIERNELEVGLLQSGDKKGFSIKLLPILPIILTYGCLTECLSRPHCFSLGLPAPRTAPKVVLRRLSK